MARLADIFIHCNQIHEMRNFYTNILGLPEADFSEEYRHLVYNILEEPKTALVIMESKEQIPVNKLWDKGPVFQKGKGYGISFTVREDDMGIYRNTISTLLGEVSCFYDQPQWIGYWTFLIKDPMGTTIDYYYEISPKPGSLPIWEF